MIIAVFRSSHLEVFLGKSVPKKCSKFTGEHPYRSVISIKMLRTLMPKFDFGNVAKQINPNHTSARVFPCKFAAYFQNTFY